MDMNAITGLFGLAGKTAVVTGGATGIGRATADLFVAAGARVAVLDINMDAATEFARRVTASGGSAIAIRMDQSDPASVAAAFAEVDTRFDRIDALVNCAGIYPLQNFETATPDFLDRAYAINFRGILLCTQEAVKRMKLSGGGSIVCISSVAAIKPAVFDAVYYGMTKAAINNMTVSVALEYGEHGIRLNAVMPGSIATEKAAASASEGVFRGPVTQPGRAPLGPPALDPSEVAAACLFLSSDASRYITGQAIAVDGGFLIS